MTYLSMSATIASAGMMALAVYIGDTGYPYIFGMLTVIGIVTTIGTYRVNK